MKLTKSKNGEVTDIIFLLVFFFAIMVTITATWFTMDDVFGSLVADENIYNFTRQELSYHQTSMPGVMDNAMTMVFFGAFLSLAAAAFLIRSNFVFFILAVFILALFIIISAMLANTYNDYLNSDAELEAYVEANFPITTHLLNNYVTYTVVMGFLVLITLYAKSMGGPESGL